MSQQPSQSAAEHPGMSPQQQTPRQPSSSSQRVLTSIAVIIPVFSLLALGEGFVGFMLLVPPMILALEWSVMASRVDGTSATGSAGGAPALDLPSGAVLFLCVALPVYLATTGQELAAWGGIGLSMLVILIYFGLRSRDAGKAASWAVGLLYCAVPYVCAASLLGGGASGLYLLMALMSLVWCTDIGAYYVGKRWGRPLPIVGAISPKKTGLGFLGGIVTGTLGFAYFVAYMPLPWWLVLLAPVFSLVAQMGDLLESFIKRSFGVKDSGTLLPGHGGLMDRMDGFTLLMPLVLFALSMGWLRVGP